MMYLSTTTINDRTIKVIFSRVLSSRFHYQKHGDMIISEFDIDEVAALSNDDKYFYPKRIFKDLLPFMVEIINADTIINAVYTFSVGLKTEYENPHDIQYFKKDIEVEITTVEERNNTENILSNYIDDLNDSSKSYASLRYNDGVNILAVPEDGKKIILTVTRMKLLDEIRREKLNTIRTFKDEDCVICINTKPNILFCDCGHTCICEECYIALEDNKCPKCRSKNKVIRKI